MAYLHGVETIVNNTGPVPVTVIKSGVIGLVGIAPIGPLNTLTAVNSVADAAQFGSPVPGFSIPQALAAIFKQGAASVLVVNVFDPTSSDYYTQVTNEAQTVTAGKLKLAYAPVSAVTIKKADGTTSTTLVKDTDYTLDEYGNYKVISTNADQANATVLKFTYKKLNAAGITGSVIIGSYNSGTGARTGIKCWALAKNQVGYNPKILIAPGYSSLSAVATELISQAGAFRAITLLDAPYATTVAGAIAGRGVDGTINFNTASKRAYLLYPYLKAYDIATDANIDYPYSQFMAGLIAATDLNYGYWYSPSNKEIAGIVGAERNISAGANDTSTDANQLNEAGITTIFNTFGTGIRTWGNRSAAYPTVTTPDNFISVQRTADVVHESLENAALQFVDRPINQALIDTIRETGNAFIRTLIQRGALITGSRVEYDKTKNTPIEIAAGHLTFDIVFMVPVPGERITFNSFIDISLLSSLT
jgi:uncharacterized protein